MQFNWNISLSAQKSQILFSFQAWRKRWLVIEFPTCDSDEVIMMMLMWLIAPPMITLWHYEQVRSCSILVRVYVSHHHENKGPPAFCVPILDVHGLHRVQSRWVTRSLSRHSQSSTTFRNKVPFPVETVVGRDRIKFISNWPYSQLFNYFYRILRPVTAVISFYRLPFLRKNF